uniref:Ubiquitin carboxyl-terminal hydrolase 13 n=1 Tax=Cyprinus carpio TaxID=7962 RepID=A0A8C2H5W8_CYPCA
MATDLGELLVPYMPTIRVPRTGDRVFKSECAFSYDSPESEGGLYVCMNTFLGFGREHVERHYHKTGQSVYMHLKRHVKEVRRVTRLFSTCDAVLNASSPYKKQEADTWEEEIQVSKHARSLRQQENGVRIPPSGWKCAKCEMRENLWLNLTDGSVLCGKWFFDGSGGNGHALEHYKETNFPLAVKLDTITPDGADIYSFDEEEAVLDPHISEHLLHFGIDMLQMQRNGHHTDNDVQPCVSDWEVIQESSLKLKPVYGSGYTGIKNLGNSCYLSTTMQVLFSIPEFQRAYVGNLQRIFDYSPLDPTQDFSTQMWVFLSWNQQRGISPKMFKALVSKGHPEFSSDRQQDAHEFFLHLINLVERNSSGSENPGDVFRFLVEERVQCCQTQKVRYTQRVDYLMQLPVPLEAASNREELIAYESKRKEAEENMRPPPEPVRARIPFTACLQAFTEPENVPDFWSSALQAKSAGVKTSRFASFPEYMVMQIKKFTFGVDWVPKKLDVSVDVPDFLDLNRLRATGLQTGEAELPDLTPPIVIPEDTRASILFTCSSAPEIDESSVMQLAEMGFPLEACRKAVYYTGNMGAEMAFNWIIAHMEEPDLPSPSFPTISALDNQPPEESISILTSMGFPRHHTIQALKATNNNLERALDWIFTHPDCEDESEAMSDTADTEPNNNSFSNANAHSDSSLSPDQDLSSPRVRDGPGRYELFAFISHMGSSTMSGHYVCHIKKEGRWLIYNDHKVCLSERPPKDLGYMYFYRRLSSC